MIIDQLIKRNFYPQTGNFSFSANLAPSTISGINIFGLSGDQHQNRIEFKLISGKVLDWNSNFVSAYSVDQISGPVSISGIVGANSVDYYINNEPKAFGVPRATGYLNYAYANSYYNNMEFDLVINGRAPSYSLDSPIIFDTGDGRIPLVVRNTSTFPFTIFSGDYLGRLDQFSVSGVLSGIISNSGTFYLLPSGVNSVGANDLSFRLYTNFGIIEPTVSVSGRVDPFSGVALELVGPEGGVNGTTGQFYARFSNSGNTLISVLPYLKYLSGSGMQTGSVQITGTYDTVATGLINYSGNVLKHITVTGSGYGGTTPVRLVSGIVDADLLSFQWATGIQLSSVSIPATGYATGIFYTGLATGMINFITSGIISGGSGFYHATGQFTGLPAAAYSFYPTGQVRATGAIYYNTPSIEDILYIQNSDYPIIKSYHYDTIDDLTSFINANTGTYYVSGLKVGSNINLTSLLTGALGNVTTIEVDSANVGNMSVSGPRLTGGLSFGLNSPVVPITPFTGHLNADINGTGLYSQNLTGYELRTIAIDDFYKQFTGTWNLQTGTSNSTMIDYRASGWFMPDTYIYQAGQITSQETNFYVNVLYNALGTSQDSAILYLSGFNTNRFVSKTITGVR